MAIWPFRKKANYLLSGDYVVVEIPGIGKIAADRLGNYIKAMALSDAIYACLTKIQLAAATVPWYLYQKRGDEIIEVTNHPVVEFLKRPGKRMTWTEFLEKYLMHKLLTGNAYLLINLPEFKTQIDTTFLHPNYVTPIRIGDKIEYRYGGQTFSEEEIIHFKMPNPEEDGINILKGLSPVACIAKKIDIHSYSEEWMFRLLENGAMPPITLSTDRPLTPDQRKFLQEQLKREYEGPEKAMNPLILEGGLKVEKVGFSPNDINFQPLQVGILRRVANVFHVPSELLGDVEYKTYSNAKEAVRALYYWVVLPHLQKLKEELNYRIVRQFGEDLFIDYDVSGIEALSADLAELWDRVGKAHGEGLISTNEAREELGWGRAEEPGADKLLVGGNVIPLEYITGTTEEEE